MVLKGLMGTTLRGERAGGNGPNCPLKAGTGDELSFYIVWTEVSLETCSFSPFFPIVPVVISSQQAYFVILN
jgi:hypothetical protein